MYVVLFSYAHFATCDNKIPKFTIFYNCTAAFNRKYHNFKLPVKHLYQDSHDVSICRYDVYQVKKVAATKELEMVLEQLTDIRHQYFRSR